MKWQSTFNYGQFKLAALQNDSNNIIATILLSSTIWQLYLRELAVEQ